jgi:hypothetical protein
MHAELLNGGLDGWATAAEAHVWSCIDDELATRSHCIISVGKHIMAFRRSGIYSEGISTSNQRKH